MKRRSGHDGGRVSVCQSCFLYQAEAGIRDQLDALRLVELVGRADEAEVALVDEVAERHALVLVLLGDRHDEAEVRAHQLVERFLIARANLLRELDLLLALEQRIRADLLEVLIQRAFLVHPLAGRIETHTTLRRCDTKVATLPATLRAPRGAGDLWIMPRRQHRPTGFRPARGAYRALPVSCHLMNGNRRDPAGGSAARAVARRSETERCRPSRACRPVRR